MLVSNNQSSAKFIRYYLRRFFSIAHLYNLKQFFFTYQGFLSKFQIGNYILLSLIIIIKKRFMNQTQYDSDEQSTTQNPSKRINKLTPIPISCSLQMKEKHKKYIIINISMTKYEVIEDVAYELGWQIQTKNNKGDWDVLWTDQAIQTDILLKMNYHQKISHFPGIHVLARKNNLGISLMDMRKKFPDAYNFFPLTWMLPNDYANLREKMLSIGPNKCTFIAKPEADCQGKGIFLTQKIEDVQNGKHYVVQQYLAKPLLIDGLKFDFRVYVLLCGVSPMRLYIYEQGLARFATQKYVQPTQTNLKKQYIHLTNYAINKKNPKYIYNSSNQNMGVGHKRSLTSVMKQIQRRGYDIRLLKTQINQAIVKTFLVGMPLVSHQYRYSQPNDQNRNMCFHILGIDIMLDQNCRPYVLEVNHTPSFATDTPLDYKIKSQLIKDTLILMNINSKSKSQMIIKWKKHQQSKNLSVGTKKQLFEDESKQQLVKTAQQKRTQYQNNHLGKYTRIYPTNSQQQMQEYDKYFQYADKIYFAENNVLRAQMQSQKKHNEEKKSKIISSPSPPKITRKNLSVPDNLLDKQYSPTNQKLMETAPIHQRNQQSLVLGFQSFGSCRVGKILLSKEQQSKRVSSITSKLPRLESTNLYNNSRIFEALHKKQYINLRKKKILQNQKFIQQSPKRRSVNFQKAAILIPKPIQIAFIAPQIQAKLLHD